MVKTITKFILLGLTPELSEKIRAEAKSRNVSVNALIRTAIEQLLGISSDEVNWTRAEKEYAHKVLLEHFEEDRNEIIRFNESRRPGWPQN